MARSREILLLLVLLVAVLLAAAPSGAAAVRGCQPEVLAPTVALFCAPGETAEWCCQALAHSARVGGGARCLCRLAAEEPLAKAGLNSTYLLWLYTACASSSGHAAGPAAPYSSYPAAPPPSVSVSVCDGAGDAPAAAPADVTGCAAASLADQMGLFCRGALSSSPPKPNPPCCEAVVGSGRGGFDGVPCFCHVAQSSRSFSVDVIASLYAACVGSGPGDARDLVGKCPSPRSAANALV